MTDGMEFVHVYFAMLLAISKGHMNSTSCTCFSDKDWGLPEIKYSSQKHNGMKSIVQKRRHNIYILMNLQVS